MFCNRNSQAFFTAALMHKDMTLAAALAADLIIPVPVLSAVKEMFQMTKARAYGDGDVCSVIRCYEERAGIEVKSRQ